ncbi:MAG: putative bifunctional diguanylate cyclase/phosphodiesterase [Solirubrobacterales bacterium]
MAVPTPIEGRRPSGGRQRVANLLLVGVAAALLLGLVQAAIAAPELPSGPLTDTIVVAILCLPVIAFYFAASAQPSGRLGWCLIGAGFVFNSAGEAYFYFAHRAISDFPTGGDFLCLALYPLLGAGVVVLVHAGRMRNRLSIGIDGMVIALAIGALAYELIFGALLRGASVSGVLVGGELAYPILDLAMITMLAVVCIPSRFRVGATYFWLMAGMAVLLATDVANVRETASGTNAPSIALYFGWGLAIVVLGVSSRFPASLTRSDALRGSLLSVSLGGAMLVSLALLLHETAHEQNLVVIGAAGAALLLGLLRLFRTLAENSGLIRERGEVIAEQRQTQSQLRFQADHDALTGLFNRRRFTERTEEQLLYARRYQHPGALLFIDLDSFKFINDSFGHSVGDQVIRRVAGAIRNGLRATDVAARLGGDEFAILLPEVDEEGALRVAETVLGAIKAGKEPMVLASVGIVLFCGDQELSAADLLVAADIALYDAKAAGHGAIRVYHGQTGMRLAWVERIREALDEERLVLDAQPIVDLRTGKVAREELLVRMIGRDGTEIPPLSFLPTAERFGLIGDIDRFAVGRGIELAKLGRPVAVNISGPSLMDRELIDRVAGAIREGMDPRMLSFELTETSSVANIEAARRFAGYLENLGCDLALDDFGTGLSSLGYLKHIPIQTLKIDTEFIRDMNSSTFNRYLVQTIVRLAHHLGQKTVAEGVEDEATLSLVREFGVDYAQGFLLGPPARVGGEAPQACVPGAPVPELESQLARL